MMNKIYKALLIVLIIFPLNLFGQNVYEVVEGKGIILRCDGKQNRVKWQKSYDNYLWEDITGYSIDSVVVQPSKKCYYRAVIGDGNCKSYSDVATVNVKSRPDFISGIYREYEIWKKSISCTWISYYKKYAQACETTYHYKLHWQPGNYSGVLISCEKSFVPQDGKSYKVGENDVVFFGSGNVWVLDDRFRHANGTINTWTLYIYCYTSEFLYSDRTEFIINILSDSNSLTYQDNCGCN